MLYFMDINALTIIHVETFYTTSSLSLNSFVFQRSYIYFYVVNMFHFFFLAFRFCASNACKPLFIFFKTQAYKTIPIFLFGIFSSLLFLHK